MKRDMARECALRVLAACRMNGAWADGALKEALRREKLDSRDAAFATNLVYGVMQNRLYLDRCLSELTVIKKLEPMALDILRLGSYQLLFLDRVPASAAINESVNLAKAHKLARAAGLINAVLRNLERKKGEMLPLHFSSELEELSVSTSHPMPLTKRIVGLIGLEEAKAFFRANNAPAPMTVHTNTLKTTSSALCEELLQAGVQVEPHPWLADCFHLSMTGNLEAMDAFTSGHFTVQDAAAKLTALVAAPQAGDFVIDTCAAPGGKSFAMAMLMGDKGKILSCDMEEHKMRILDGGAKRLGIGSVKAEIADGRVLREELVEKADVVVCDVPCSGLGIIRKKPDIRYKDLQEVRNLPPIQRDILWNAAHYVKPGGTLVYSTCTILPEENEAITDAFVAEHSDFSYEPFDLPFEKTAGHITLWPQRTGTDGFYIAKLKRKL